MAKARARGGAPAVQIPKRIGDPYWADQVKTLGRNLFFLDTGAILGALTPEETVFSDFIDRTLLGAQLITSAFVVTETARRIIKDKYQGQVGPDGERGKELALLVTNRWLSERSVAVLHIPEQIFDSAREAFTRRRDVPCDLTDIISYQIVTGLGLTRIVANDQHFEQLGLTCLPGRGI
jgi:predicted nucleic acid-binding protein